MPAVVLKPSRHLFGLNPEQRSAVSQTEGPVLILAGAGTGKTKTIVHRIAHLIEGAGVEPFRIAAVTFTNRAADEMRERVQSYVGDAARQVTLSTFHSLGVRIIRDHYDKLGLPRRFAVYGSADQLAALKTAASEVRFDNDSFDLKRILWQISDWKSKKLSPQAAREVVIATQSTNTRADDYAVLAVDAYPKYEEVLRASGAVDYDDLLLLPVQLLEANEDVRRAVWKRWHYIMIDEYQDTNAVQLEMARLLAGTRRNLCVVGDDDQSIYAWRGAKPENLAQLQTDWPNLEVVKLEQNYRSTGRILKAANAVISNNPHVFEKTLWSDYGYGDPIRVVAMRDEDAETDWIASDLFHQRLQRGLKWKDFAILYRGNFQSRLIETKLQSLQIPYKVSGGKSFFARSEIKDLMCYLRLLVNPDDDNAFLRIINTPRREIGPATLEKLAGWAAQRNQGLYHVCDDLGVGELMAPKAAERLREFKQWLDRKREFCFRDNSVQAVRELITDMDYESWLHQQSASPRVAEKRIENVWSLVASIQRMLEKDDDEPTDLETVIAKLVLIDMLEQQDEEDDSDKVQLMTLHAAKGLEYPHVYVMGVEEELLPHRTSIEEDTIVEERRLMYVGITRAKRNLTLSYAMSRKQFGEKVDTTPSRFLEELPQDDLEFIGEGFKTDESRADEVAEASLAGLRALLG